MATTFKLMQKWREYDFGGKVHPEFQFVEPQKIETNPAGGATA